VATGWSQALAALVGVLLGGRVALDLALAQPEPTPLSRQLFSSP